VRHAETIEMAVRAVFLWGPFEAVVCDYQLPDGNGLVFKNWLREQVINLPFLLMSGDVPAVKTSRRFSVLSKPFQIQEFRTALDRLLPNGIPRAEWETVAVEHLRA
jgi:DNA-binding NtrC family response regulator